jgi:homoserine dehydrogenase
MLKVGIVGCGTVGSGVVKILRENSKIIDSRISEEIEVSVVADKDISKVISAGIPRDRATDNWRDVVDSDVDVVVELIGGKGIAKDVILESISSGKHVVTANKALLSDFGEEIFNAAKEKGVSIGFEASVGGGIPVIKALTEGLVANRILRILGIINGTANFILTEMTKNRVSFENALERAKELGYAEADPTLDIEGFDTAHKIAILSSLAFCRWVKTNNVYIKGISDITPLDIEFAHEFGYRIKLLAVAKVSDGSVEVRVHPTMLPDNHILSNVEGVYNALLIEGDFVGSTLYYGKGAGMNPTASAVVSDICDIALNRKKSVPDCLFKENSKVRLKAPDEFVSSFYLRFTAKDKPGVLAKISSILGKYNISIKMALQKSIDVNGGVPIVMTTHPAQKSTVAKAVLELDGLDVILKPTFVCMIEE